MDRSKKLSETEYEIMEVLWNSEVPMSASQILSYFAEHRNKGLLTSKREGRVPYYWPIKTCEEYQKSNAQRILDTLYGGSIKNFFAALYGESQMSEEDREALKQWLDRQP